MDKTQDILRYTEASEVQREKEDIRADGATQYEGVLGDDCSVALCP